VSSQEKTRPRSPERLRVHYDIERELADRLRSAPREARLGLYRLLYDELFRRVPDHPQLMRKVSEEKTLKKVITQTRFLRRFLRPGITFLEIGAGDCSLSIEVAKTAKKVYALDVSEMVTAGIARRSNVEVVLSDGVDIPLPEGSVDLAFSNQLMEHLHPEDALEQLRNILRALAPGGRYVCITPNRLSGPHDVSANFDQIARGFHLKEYEAIELSRLFRSAGFAEALPYAYVKGQSVALQLPLVAALEKGLAALPFAFRRRLARSRPWNWVLGIHMVGRKAG